MGLPLQTNHYTNSEIAAAQSGDREAFHRIYLAHVGKVYALCFRLSGDTSTAEDATQEVFIQVWRKIQTYKGDSLFSTWLHSVSSNVAISYLRKQRSWWQKISISQINTYTEKVDSMPADITELERCLTRLPDRMRHVFVLHGLEGYRHEDVAEMLKIKVGTSKTQFHRARAMIEEWLNEL